MKKIYLDYASTTPADPDVIKAMEPFWGEQFGNASSPHSFGREAQKALENSRDSLARALNAKQDEIIFTSSATESNNHAIIGTAHSQREKGKHIIVSKVEHHSVLEPVEFLEKEGYEITYLSVDEHGCVDPQDVKDAITDETILVCVMYGSNEIGTIQPINEIGEITRDCGVTFLVDAVQAVGHIPVNVEELKADLLSLSAHKFYGPKGIGGLYVRDGIQLSSYLRGGDQEKGRRASTQNVAGAVGLAKAIELCLNKLDDEMKTQTELRHKIIENVLNTVDEAVLNGHPEKRLPNNAHFSFNGVQGEALLMSLDMANIAASMGSACTSGALEPSHVLRAIGRSDELAYGSLRISVGRWTTSEDIEYFLEQLPAMIKRVCV